VLAETLQKEGFRLVSGGTDNHLMLVDLTAQGITGKEAQETLDRMGITVNKNGIPFDTKGPMITSGIRIGTPAVTTRGMKEEEMRAIGGLIASALRHKGDDRRLGELREEVSALCARFPLYASRL
jgi:glycine hydroxymethyltransferase